MEQVSFIIIKQINVGIVTVLAVAVWPGLDVKQNQTMLLLEHQNMHLIDG